MSDNPLLDNEGLPHFGQIRPEHIEPAIDRVLAEIREQAETILRDREQPGWREHIAPLEALGQRLARTWSPVSHLHGVADSEALRQAYNACLPKLSAYATECGQDRRRYEVYAAVAEAADTLDLDQAQRQLLRNALRDFRLSGIELAEEDRRQYAVTMQELSQQMALYSENVLDATQAWEEWVSDRHALRGMPDSAIEMAAEAATRAGGSGWRLTLDAPCYLAVITHADDRALRERIYSAFATRASDQGPHAGQWDNGPVMLRILELRHQEARLLGYDNYAEKALTTRMARHVDDVIDFLEQLARKALPVAKKEMAELRRYARDEHGIDDLRPWDIAYYSEKMRQDRFAISAEALRPYFPVERVLDGLFAIVARLYGLRIEAQSGVETWHPDVRFFAIHDEDGELRGQFFLDLYAREGKRGGAWMDECINRQRHADGQLTTPVAYLTCNFLPPAGDQPGLLSHDEVTTLFHEFGHGLHHLLTRIDEAAVAGIQGVPWDAVELPSQFMENWCWQAEALPLISAHFKDGSPLPNEMLERLLAARNFQAGMRMVRQLEFALFDFRLHKDFDPALGVEQIASHLQQARQQVAVIELPDYHRFAHSFAHIFAGGYAAGYYSYKWAEVLASDAFAVFSETGIFDQASGRRFLSAILERGGSEDALTLFTTFRGREPQIDALLRQDGILADDSRNTQ